MQPNMRMIQQMQNRMAKIQEELGETTVSAGAGGDMVTVEVTGLQEVRSIKIKPEAVDPDDVETLEDLVLAAIHNAMEAVRDLTEEKMGPLASGLGGLGGGLGIPGF